jgi:2-polyprenyl-3-methyl-5-hydroxy-6-metoxy-1,4-benzoquinol methylase
MPFRLPFLSTRVRPAAPRLGSVAELESASFRAFMAETNAFAARHGLRQFTDWTKVWEYPWLQQHGIGAMDWRGRRLVDFGSEISPLPWILATQGAEVTLIEADPQWQPIWEKLRTELGVKVDWHIVTSELLPLPDACADAVTSFSVIEHQPNKKRAIAEIARVLKRRAPFFISFDICEPDMGMTFPEWNGRALTFAEFEQEIWLHPAFGNSALPPWNLETIPAYKAWHLRSAAHHNYVTGAAVLVKR